jgi:DNA-binding LytR/AlgR family response regulator
MTSTAVPVVVFVTAHDKFALRAFEVHAADYLLKPFDRERFKKALARALGPRETPGRRRAASASGCSRGIETAITPIGTAGGQNLWKGNLRQTRRC